MLVIEGVDVSLEVDMVSVLYVLSAGDLVLGFVSGSSICTCHNLQHIISHILHALLSFPFRTSFLDCCHHKRI